MRSGAVWGLAFGEESSRFGCGGYSHETLSSDGFGLGLGFVLALTLAKALALTYTFTRPIAINLTMSLTQTSSWCGMYP